MDDFLKTCNEFVGWILGINPKPKPKRKRKRKAEKNGK